VDRWIHVLIAAGACVLKHEINEHDFGIIWSNGRYKGLRSFLLWLQTFGTSVPNQ
jgi:hypothetical protein